MYAHYASRVVRIIFAVTLSSAVGSCTVLNPYVGADRPLLTASAATNGPVTLREGLAYAARLQENYREAVGDQALLRNVSAVTLIGIVSAATGIALTAGGGVGTAALVGGGLGSAALFSSALWLNSTPRQRVYIAGYRALSCAVDAVIPLEMDPVAIKRFLEVLSASLSALEAKLAEAETMQASLTQGTAPAVALSEAIQRAQAARIHGEQAYSSGVELELAIRQAGLRLMNAVDRISTLVDEAVLSTESELSALPAVLQGLTGLATQLVQVPDPAAFPRVQSVLEADAQNFDNDKFTVLLEELNGATADTTSKARRVAALVNSVNSSTQLDKLRACGVEISEIDVTAITTEPSGEMQIELGAGVTRGFTIRGGKPGYSVRFLDNPAGLTVRQPIPFGAFVEVMADGEQVAGTYNLQISDLSLNTKIMVVSVVQGQPAPDESDGSGQDADATNANAITTIQLFLMRYGFMDKGTPTRVIDEATTVSLDKFLSLIQHERKGKFFETLESFEILFDELITHYANVDHKTDNEGARAEGVRNVTIELLMVNTVAQMTAENLLATDSEFVAINTPMIDAKLSALELKFLQSLGIDTAPGAEAILTNLDAPLANGISAVLPLEG
jgi:hypothetical protein